MEQESTEQKGIGRNSIDSGSIELKNTGSAGTVQRSTGKTPKHNGKRKKKRRKKKSSRKLKVSVNLEPKSFLAGIAAGVLLTLLAMFLLTRCSAEEAETSGLKLDASEPEISVQLLDVNDYSRPGTEVDSVAGIVIHYTANPGSTAQQNRDYFNSLQDGHGASVSSHFIVGLDGEIVQCIPTQEVAYASNERNHDTVSIECCHPDATGKFNQETYISMVRLTAFLCAKYNLDAEAVIRHYDVTEKNCPKYFVENEDAWKLFKADVNAALKTKSKEE
ncbi:N-acetylmuramoyl-L-alanine amidase [Lachnospiraceae bacterium]|jgi:N-acetylmuramoyl-L-alanine amidase|nr:peptidoglycan recognition family protein [uncultured Schaedlerella sp.]EOS37638.1 hypothetical protein C808_03618 [Lachnospiraceae bacterium M18-1]MCI9153689.1 N-acetylmuramoyl-L-alanine amidase [Ruminococcus sp.]NBI59334.1 N-acetylmuramoyl-L-alanine amidase [Lachnospiraceae bacterium]